MPALVDVWCRICKKEVLVGLEKICRIPDNKGSFYAAYVFDTEYRCMQFEHGVRELIVCGLMENMYCAK